MQKLEREFDLSVTSLNVPTVTGNIKLEASPTTPLFIVGQNGTGKSALMQNFAIQLSGRAIYLPGSRPSYFAGESLSLTPSSRKDLTDSLRRFDQIPETRWRHPSSISRNEKAIHDLTAAETQFKVDAANEIAREGRNSAAITRLQSCMSPLDRVNALLKQSNLPVTVAIETGELKAVREGSSYSIARMSDGERIAIVMMAEVVAAHADSIFLIDEPEVHLHRAIVVPLISSMMRERPDITFIVGTHELELLTSCPHSSIGIVRGCSWNSPDTCVWEIDTVSTASDIPNDIRTDILGSRRKILFIEGSASSLDSPLYSLLFPNASVRSRESCRDVERIVSGLQATQDIHSVQVFGMIDRDGMSDEQTVLFRSKNVYPLEVHSVESLYYAEELLSAIAERQGETLGVEPDTLIRDAKRRAIDVLALNGCMEHLASKIAERQLRDEMLKTLPDRTSLMNVDESCVSISIPSTYPVEIARLKHLYDTGDLSSIVSRYPVRESGVLNALAKGLRFNSRTDYESAVLRRLSLDESLCDLLRTKFERLAPLLA